MAMTDKRAMRVASYNIRKALGTDRQRSPERIADVLGEIDADVMALQEADRRFGTRSAALPAKLIEERGYRAVPLGLQPHSLGWHGNAILVRSRFAIGNHGHIDLPTIEPRGAVYAELTDGGDAIRIVGMHLDLSGIRRRVQARTVIEFVRSRPPMPTVLMGDLNEWRPHGGCIADFAQHFRIAATGPSFHSRRPVGRLDRIMADDRLEIRSSGVHHSLRTRNASDHLPVWADIEFARSGFGVSVHGR